MRSSGSLRIAREASRVALPVSLHGRGSLVWDKRFHVTYDLPAGRTYVLRTLERNRLDLPLATPSLWHLDALAFVPHITPSPEGCVRVGFAPAKPLAAAPFWWLNNTTPAVS